MDVLGLFKNVLEFKFWSMTKIVRKPWLAWIVSSALDSEGLGG